MDGDSRGKVKEASVTEKEILRHLRESDERVLTTPEIADGLNVSRRTALRHLSDLAEVGVIGRKDIGGRASVWWAIEEETEADAPAAPLRQLVGALDDEAATAAKERSDAWREEIDDELTPDES